PAPAKPPRWHVAPGSVQRLEGGLTVEECFRQKDRLAGKEVKLRGIVVKFLPDILGANWLHLRDGTGRKGTDDLVVTTRDQAAPGDLVTVTGKLARDKNLGAGYRFPVLIEGARIKVEKRGALAPAKAGSSSQP
ncbi:MAG: hypothetical protein D6766_00675, partial [Verrucomicrobia bacterium]